MKKVLVLFVALFATLTLFAQKAGSIQDQQACEYARRSSNAEIWQDYLKQFPQGMCAFEAKSEIKKQKSNSQNGKGNLQWSNKVSKMNWMMAVDYCQNLQEGGHSDWRLPSIDELRTLIKNCPQTEVGGSCNVSEKGGCLSERCTANCFCPIIENNITYYSKMGDESTLWSSSVLEGDPNSPYFKWAVRFFNGGIIADKVGQAYSVRCVR